MAVNFDHERDMYGMSWNIVTWAGVPGLFGPGTGLSVGRSHGKLRLARNCKVSFTIAALTTRTVWFVVLLSKPLHDISKESRKFCCVEKHGSCQGISAQLPQSGEMVAEIACLLITITAEFRGSLGLAFGPPNMGHHRLCVGSVLEK